MAPQTTARQAGAPPAAFAPFILSALIALVAAILVAPVPARGDEPTRAKAWLDEMARFFDEHPDYKEKRGHGWNPYNRFRWLYEKRKPLGDAADAGTRWEAWQVVKSRFPEWSKRSDAAAAWFQLGPSNLSGRILDIEFDPYDADVVYAGSASGGVWKSIDGGDSWAVLTDDLPDLAAGAVAVLPSDTDIILLGTGEATFAYPGLFGVGLLRSTDGGATWTATNLTASPGGSQGFHSIEVNPLTGTALAGANDGLYRSVDDGATWTEMLNGNYYDVKWRPGDSTRVYAVGGPGGDRTVRVSDDDGVTWAVAGTGQPSPSGVGKSQLAVTPADPDMVYVHYVGGGGNSIGIYRSEDNGATWTARNTTDNVGGGQGWYNLTLAADPNDADRIVTGGVNLYTSSDGGVTLSQTGGGGGLGGPHAVHVDHHAVAYEPGSNSDVWVGSDGGVWKSADDGDTWDSRREGLVTYQFYDICVAQSNAAFMMGGTQDNGVPGRSGVDVWFESNLYADGMVCNINPVDDTEVYAEWQFGNHVKSDDGGGSWSDIQNGLIGNGMWVTPVDQDQNDPDRLFTSTDLGIFRTADGGVLWEKISSKTKAAEWISVSPVDGNFAWVLAPDSAAVFYTANDGDSWNTAGAYPFAAGSPGKILAHPTDLASAFVTFTSYGSPAKIAVTNDTGATWTDVTGDLPDIPVNAVAVDPLDTGAWYIGTDLGVWTSDDGGATWTPYGTGMPNVVVLDLEIHKSARKLVAGTHGRGAWEADLPVEPTGVGATPIPVASRNLMLDPPSPNPVRSTTLLRFAARAEGTVTLDVYDVRGRRVSRIGDFGRGDGIVRQMEWSADRLSSGLYFLVLRGGGEQLARRVVITR